MSLAAMLNGQGATGLFEGVSEEAMAKYSIENGPVVMAMECAELLNTAFMEGFYAVNDVEISAVVEGYQSVTESSEKMNKIREHVKNAGKAIAEVFRKMAGAVRGFFANIGKKIRERALASDKFFNSLPGSIKTITYEGYDFKGLDEIRDVLYKTTPSNMLDSCKEMGDVVTGKDITEEDLEKIKAAHTEIFADLRKSFNIDDNTSLSDGFWSYFRSGATKDQIKECKIAVSEVKKLTKSGDKLAKNMDEVSKAIEKDYLNYASECEKSAEGDDSTRGNAWRSIAGTAREFNNYLTTLASSWLNAYNEACAQWGYGARAYLAKEKKNAKTDGGDN